MKRFLYCLYFLSLVPEEQASWGGSFSPLQYISSFIAWNPLKLPMLDIAVLVILFAGKDRAPKLRTAAMVKTMRICIGALVIWILWGLVLGSNTYQIQFQLHSLGLSFLLAFAMVKVLATPQDFYALGKVLCYAAVYRSLTCIAFYYSKALAHLPAPDYCTSHSDSVLYVAGIMTLFAYALEHWRTLSTVGRLKIAASILTIVLAIQYNNRRMAWVSLMGALLVTYFLVPVGPLKKKLNRTLLKLAPVIALYVIVGTGRTEGIFKPLQTLSSVKSDKDNSTKSRDNENMGLLVTLGVHPFMGWGWGQPYIEVDNSLSAGAVGFTQYRYLPHNSVLGLLAFTGVLGFAATWMVFPMSVLCNAYAAKHTSKSIIRMVGIVGAADVIVVINQCYGDLGLNFQTPMLVMASSLAAAVRLPALCQREQSTSKSSV